MTIDEEQRRDCVESIVTGLTRTSEFRARKANEYPDDLRNAKAAGTLKLLAKQAAEDGEELWEILQYHYNPDSMEWQDAISLATKEVGFANKSKSLAYFIQRLIRIASQQSNVAA